MSIQEFATRTEFIARENKTANNFWPIGIDYGFSGVKCFSPNKIFCFPNCSIQKMDGGGFLDAGEHDIILKDKDGMWIIGEKASDLMSVGDSMNYESELYGRNRYFSPVFQAVMKAGLGIALSSNRFRKYHGETIVVQTGLPPKYHTGESDDTAYLKEAISGKYNFELKIGKGPFQRYIFSISEGDIYVMDQPLGSLLSCITDNNAMQQPKDVPILTGRTLVVDPGFKTLDIFKVVSGMAQLQECMTFDTLGMHEILRRTVEALHKKYNAKLSISGMQSAIRRGYINAFDRKLMRTTKQNFEDVLVDNTSMVCTQAIEKLLSIYDYLQDIDNLVLTGGTGDAWSGQIMEYFKNMETLRILKANKNDTTLANIYSNVRGYYYYLIGYLGRRR